VEERVMTNNSTPFSLVVLKELVAIREELDNIKTKNKTLDVNALTTHSLQQQDFQRLILEYPNLPSIDRIFCWCKDNNIYNNDTFESREAFISKVTLVELYPKSLHFLSDIYHDVIGELRLELKTLKTHTHAIETNQLLVAEEYKSQKTHIRELRLKNMVLEKTVAKARTQFKQFKEWHECVTTVLGKRQRQVSGLLECHTQMTNNMRGMRPLWNKLCKLAQTKDDQRDFESMRHFIAHKNIPEELNIIDVDVPEINTKSF
jgi:hypothetical protein